MEMGQTDSSILFCLELDSPKLKRGDGGDGGAGGVVGFDGGSAEGGDGGGIWGGSCWGELAVSDGLAGCSG